MIGIDIFNINRVDKLLTRERFLDRFFTEAEKQYLESKNLNQNSIAGIVAAKEAVAKAFGVGISEELGLLDIEILHNDKNAPYVNTEKDKIKILMNKDDVKSINISISHDGEYAIAICKLLNIKNKDYSSSVLPERKNDSNKYDFGKILIIGGSKGMVGSVYLATEAALRSGAGLVYALVPQCVADILESKTTEQIILTLDDNGKSNFGNFRRVDLLNAIQNKSVVAIGPGMGVSENSRRILEIVLNNFDGPIVVDADAINILAKYPELIKDNIYITPHEMEFSRISGYSLNEILYDREGFVHNFLDRYDVNILLKGKNSIVADRNQLYINQTGNSGMSTAGAGDVLTGVAAAFLARENNIEMFKLACFIHGMAGDLASKRFGKTGMIARDIVKYLPYAIGEIDGD